ncbi:MAG: hypothetical protein IJ386_04590 [Clostridia bacterium]|nr:hypothetical protein [Clostridia bacterium]
MKRKPYPNEIIIPLKGADRVRKRPAVIFGDEGLDGCEHAFYGLFENAVDEAKDGFADTVTITVTDDGTIEIGDNGRGVPMGWNVDEQEYNWRLIFGELFVGGKFGGDPLGGLDACAAQYASDFTEVYSYDGEHESYMHFTKGNADTDLRVTSLEFSRRGTLIRWKPDPGVFTETHIPKDYFETVMRDAAILTPGLRLTLNYCGDVTEYCYNGGIAERLCEIAGDSRKTEPYVWSFGGTGRDREESPEYSYSCEIALCAAESGHEKYYHNDKPMPFGGASRDAVRSAITRCAEKYLPDCHIDTDSIFSRIMVICSTGSGRTHYTNGTRMAIANPFIGSHMAEQITEIIAREMAEDPHRAKTFFESLI